MDVLDDRTCWSSLYFWMLEEENRVSLQFSMGAWCPDYYDPINMLEPLFSSTGRSNWSGLANATIDANLEALKYLKGDAKQAMVDKVVTQIIVEQAAALYAIASADLIAWNQNPEDGILSGAEVLLNSRGDKYFYPIEFAQSGTLQIPSYPPLYILISSLIGLLVFRNKKIERR